MKKFKVIIIVLLSVSFANCPAPNLSIGTSYDGTELEYIPSVQNNQFVKIRDYMVFYSEGNAPYRFIQR
jgi:hypothetical protein